MAHLWPLGPLRRRHVQVPDREGGLRAEADELPWPLPDVRPDDPVVQGPAHPHGRLRSVAHQGPQVPAGRRQHLMYARADQGRDGGLPRLPQVLLQRARLHLPAAAVRRSSWRRSRCGTRPSRGSRSLSTQPASSGS